MLINRTNNLNFGMARIKGGFYKIAVDALLEAHSRSPQHLSAVKGDLCTIGRSLDGDVRVQTINNSQAIIYRSKRSFWDVLTGADKWEHLLHPIRNGESPVSIVAHTADALQRYSDLHNKKICITPNDLQRVFSDYVDETNAIFGKEKTKKHLKH